MPHDAWRVRACKGDGAVVSLLLLVAGCSGPSYPPVVTTTAHRPPSSTASAQGGTSLDCNAIDDVLPPANRLVVLGSVAVPNPALAPALQTGRDPSPSSSVTTFFAKDGLGIKIRTRWRIIVAPESVAHLRIGWGSPAVPGLSVAPSSTCDVQTSTGWLWYPGGYWTDQPGCYAVIVEVGTRQQQVNVGVGAPCPGQQPPQGVSDH